MSAIFYDHLISLEELEKIIKTDIDFPEEKEELWKLIDEVIHHRVLGCILDHLDTTHHEEFLLKFHKAPHDLGLIDFLNNNIGKNIKELIKQEIGTLTLELLHEVKNRKKS